jgi:3-methylcrotonyl-CoA carboxylase alpha subunit
MFSSLLIANRGEIACRVIRTARRLGLRTVAVYSQADAQAMHVAMADDAVLLGPPPAKESYLRGDAIIAAAKASGAEAIHPGYGFLSENAEFADAVVAAGLIWVGPPASAIRAMGLKDAAKALMIKAGVPVVPGYQGPDQSLAVLRAEAQRVGYPVMIKAVAGGGGKGMRKVDVDADFAKALEGAQREGQNSFGDPRVLIEKYVSRPRHVEVQVFADAHGNAVHLFERDCSVQRRHQKVIEEAPAPGMTEQMRHAMGAAAVQAAKAIGYRGAGTVEFIVDASQGLRADGFYFMEMNTRLQVEHPVTEMITGQDLVEWQLRVAAGEPLPMLQEDLEIDGHAIEVRLYAEDPAKGFLPSTGTLARLKLPQATAQVRTDTGVRQGDTVTMFYDPMIAKVIAWGETRAKAAEQLAWALTGTEVAGVRTNLAFLIDLLRHKAFLAGEVDTGFIDRHSDTLFPPASQAPREARILAALDHVLRRKAAMAPHGRPWADDPWNAQAGWRLGPPHAERLLFADGAEVNVTPERHGYRIRLDGRDDDVTATRNADGDILGMVSGRRLKGSVVQLAGEHLVLLNGRGHAFAFKDLLAGDDLKGAGGLTLTAPMPGKVVSVFVKPGDAVSRGQPVVVLEAMKMEHTLSAPGDLVVDALPFAAGDQVAEGAIVASFRDTTSKPGAQ